MQTIALVKKKRATIHDIARELKITASTVSRALNGNPSISEVTRKAVEEMAGKLNYQPNHIAAALRSGRSYIVGVIVPAADRTFFASIIRGIEEEIGQAGYSVIVCQTYDDFHKERKVLDTLMRTQVDGVIASPGKHGQDYEHFRKLQSKGMHLILFDNAVNDLGVSTVMINDFSGAYLAVQHLIQQGCHRIAHLAGPQHIGLYRERLRGYRAALEHYGRPFDKNLVLDCPSEVERGRACASILMQMAPRPDAIFSASDYGALGAMQWLKEHHIAIPDQVAIVGFANEPFTSFVDPPLSTVDQHSQRIGLSAAEAFLREIGSQEKTKTEQIVLEPELIIRSSSIKIKK